MSTISKENYLKAVFNTNYEDGVRANTSGLAEKLEVSNAAISEMAKKLSDEGLLTYAKYKGMGLTDKGEELALQIIRRHRLWELFLIESLGLSWSEVHDEAEHLEHSTSDFLIDKIDEYLGYPEFDPHGSPIPQKDGSIPEVPESFPLKDAETGKRCVVIKVNDSRSDLIHYISRIGIKLRKEVKIIDKLEFDNSVIVEIDGNNHSLSEFVARNLFVAEVK